MKQNFGTLPSGEVASLYTITGGGLSASISDYGATLVHLLVPDAQGHMADVVLGFDNANDYTLSTCFFGAIVGRNANRIQGATFSLNGKQYSLCANDNGNSLHSGPDCFHLRMWEVTHHTQNSLRLHLHSPHGDQGFPGNADIAVTYTLDHQGLHIVYDAICDRDTVFNFTNHTYFNLAGHQHTDKAMAQLLTLPGRFFTPADAESIPHGEERNVADTPMDFRHPKPIGQDIDADYDALNLQGGYDHNWEIYCNPCAILQDPVSGRTMAVYTDCPGIQLYTGNYIHNEAGKGGVIYNKRSGICLETQFFPNAVNVPHWVQPITRAGEKYHSETIFSFR